MKVVLDTNVLISALIKPGKPRRLLGALLSQDDALILSDPIIDEFSRITADERISKYADDEAIASFLAALLLKATFVGTESKVNVFNDPDDMILATAKVGGADLIVTGDRHILELRIFGSSKIVTVNEGLTMLEGKRP